MLRRAPIFLFGVVTYAFFFATFCYLYLFATNLLVPKTIDSPAADGNFPVWLGPALLVFFGVQHAIMARPGFKAWLTRFFPQAAERSLFVLIAAGILAATMWVWQPIDTVIWEVTWEPARIALQVVATLGIGLVLLSTFLIDHFDLFGLRQVTLHLLGKPYGGPKFFERSVYRHIRHPLMTGFLIWMWAAPTLTVGHLLFAGILTVYVAIGLQLEERDLIAAHGEDYLSYKRRVPSLVPSLFRRSSVPQPVAS